jgi:predicted RND superfamily exporter protein
MGKTLVIVLVLVFAAIGGGFLGAGAGLFGVLFGTAFTLGLAFTGMFAMGMLSDASPDMDIDPDDNDAEDEPYRFD